MSYLTFQSDMSNPAAVILAPVVADASSNASQRQAEWERLRPVIKELYVDEDKPLKEVMAIMERAHGHRGTIKMYKQRITKWHLDKKTKEDEAWTVLRKKSQRAAIGKESAFRVRGKPVTIDDVLRYFKRKGILDPETHPGQHLPPTPPAIECWTPVSSPISKSATIPDLLAGREVQGTDLNSVQSCALRSEQDNCMRRHFNIDQARQIIFSDPEISSFEIPFSPLPPRNLLVAEKLFSSIATYFEGAVRNGLFKTNDNGYLVKRSSETMIVVDPAKFYNLCYVAINLMNSNSFIEGRRFLSKASSMISGILRNQNPRILQRFLDSLLMIESSGYNQIATSLRRYICEMTKVLFADGHPWRQLFTQLADIEESHSQSTLLEAWRCSTDTLTNYLGQFHRSALLSNLEFLTTKGSDAPRLLRDLLIRGEQELGEVDGRVIEIKHIYGMALYTDNQYATAVEVLEEVFVHCNELKGWEYGAANSLDVITRCKYYLGSYDDSDEFRLREGIGRLEAKYGKSDPTVLGIKTCLVIRFRRMGREVEAAKVQAEIDEALGPDDIDVDDY